MPAIFSLPRGANVVGSRERGFNIVELMVTMAIIVVVMMVAVPKLLTNSPSREANTLYADIEFARSQAIKGGQSVVLCASTDGNTCAGTAWASGWVIVAPANNSCAAIGGATGDAVLRVQSALSTSDSVTYTPSAAAASAGNNYLCFNRMGFANPANTGLFVFDTNPSNNAQRRCLALSAVGHAQVLRPGQSDVAGVVCN